MGAGVRLTAVVLLVLRHGGAGMEEDGGIPPVWPTEPQYSPTPHMFPFASEEESSNLPMPMPVAPRESWPSDFSDFANSFPSDPPKV